jgi:hypothetical protein
MDEVMFMAHNFAFGWVKIVDKCDWKGVNTWNKATYKLFKKHPEFIQTAKYKYYDIFPEGVDEVEKFLKKIDKNLLTRENL